MTAKKAIISTCTNGKIKNKEKPKEMLKSNDVDKQSSIVTLTEKMRKEMIAYTKNQYKDTPKRKQEILDRLIEPVDEDSNPKRKNRYVLHAHCLFSFRERRGYIGGTPGIPEESG